MENLCNYFLIVLNCAPAAYVIVEVYKYLFIDIYIYIREIIYYIYIFYSLHILFFLEDNV